MSDYNYWLVGATWGEKDFHGDKFEDFTQNGIWMLGYRQEADKTQYEKAKKMKINDRIAIKRNQGFANKPIKILKIGIIKGVIHDIDRVTCVVKWIDSDIKTVESGGCIPAVNGPYKKSEEHNKAWLDEIFSL